MHHLQQLVGRLNLVRRDGLCIIMKRSRRDLPPKETSQIARVLGCNETVCDDQVLPAVAVEVGEI